MSLLHFRGDLLTETKGIISKITVGSVSCYYPKHKWDHSLLVILHRERHIFSVGCSASISVSLLDLTTVSQCEWLTVEQRTHSMCHIERKEMPKLAPTREQTALKTQSWQHSVLHETALYNNLAPFITHLGRCETHLLSCKFL